MKKLITSVAMGAIVAGGLAFAPSAQALPCGGGGGFGSGGSQCDSAPAPDGSFERCVSVYVLGFGGWNCHRVFPGAPPA